MNAISRAWIPFCKTRVMTQHWKSSTHKNNEDGTGAKFDNEFACKPLGISSPVDAAIYFPHMQLQVSTRMGWDFQSIHHVLFITTVVKSTSSVS